MTSSQKQQSPWSPWVVVAGILAGGFLAFDTLRVAWATNGTFGFPLDDAWIHLQFARNLHDYGSFSYFRNEMVTAGSTSPLYTCLLALGFFFVRNEFTLSYALGILALLGAGIFMYKYAALWFERSYAAAAAAILIVLEPRLQWIALSGMETTLFIMLLLAAFFFYATKKPVLLGISCGLLLWTRPDAITAIIALAGGIIYEGLISSRPQSKGRYPIPRWLEFSWLKRAMPVFLGFAVVYVGFNLFLSGRLLPNTFAAKIKYYSGSTTNFPDETLHFLSDGPMIVPGFFAAVSILAILWAVIRRRRTLMLIPFLWGIGLFASYWIDLPRLYQHGRYLMPLLPVIILLAVDGAGLFATGLGRLFQGLRSPAANATVGAVLYLGIAVTFGIMAWNGQKGYAADCQYITERQVRTARWIKDNLPPDAVLATHDIGAIAFYSYRRVVDMVGLVSPEMINNIGRFDLLMQFLVRSKVTHLAVLRNWFEVVNEQPLFETDPTHPEIMEVFRFDPARTHFTSQEATRLNDAGEYYLATGNPSVALQLFRRALTLDPQSARSNFLVGRALQTLGDTATARTMFRNALGLQPDYPSLQQTK